MWRPDSRSRPYVYRFFVYQVNPLDIAARNPHEQRIAGGLRQWRDLLAAASGLAEGGRLVPCAPGTTGPIRQERQGGLVEGKPGLDECSGQKGGEAVGPNPTDRGKPGSKHHILTDRNGIPLAGCSPPPTSTTPRFSRS
jgi:hypothetical protein